jgi:Flp pilus assembly protein TadD
MKLHIWKHSRRLSSWSSLLSSVVLLVACATQPAESPPETLFLDALFSSPSERISADDVFVLSDAMRRYLDSSIARQVREKGPYKGLFDALYSEGELKLEYDSSTTRNAAQAFESRAGNCLSLVIMTAAFAKALGLEVQYQTAITSESWSRSSDLYLRSGHVNVLLGRGYLDRKTGEERYPWRIDFLPPEQTSGLRTQIIPEATIVAMYLNNRAAEALIQGNIDNAYWWARAAIVMSPAFLSAYNTLGVVYLRRGALAPAERAFRHAVEREPANTVSLPNLALALRRQGRIAESEALYRKLSRIEPQPPFYYFDLGMAAMRRHDFEVARQYFTKEVERDAYYHEFHFWLGVANYRLGDLVLARRHLNLALENSATSGHRELYSAKLASIRSSVGNK